MFRNYRVVEKQGQFIVPFRKDMAENQDVSESGVMNHALYGRGDSGIKEL
jgi:hypothetical protein